MKDMRIDKKATRYEYDNGRFDLMTDEEVRTLTCDDVMLLYLVLSREGPGGSTEELCHRMYELHCRYPDRDFRIEVAPKQKEEKE